MRRTWYVQAVVRLCLAIWLAAFTFQATDLLALVAADECTESVDTPGSDPCPESCPRCLCCVRVATFIPTAVTDLAPPVTRLSVLPPAIPSTTPSPHGILHVPKHS